MRDGLLGLCIHVGGWRSGGAMEVVESGAPTGLQFAVYARWRVLVSEMVVCEVAMRIRV